MASTKTLRNYRGTIHNERIRRDRTNDRSLSRRNTGQCNAGVVMGDVNDSNAGRNRLDDRYVRERMVAGDIPNNVEQCGRSGEGR